LSGINLCASTLSQAAALEALSRHEHAYEKIFSQYENNCDHLIREINELEYFKCVKPQGTFYLFPEITGLKISGRKFCELFRTNENVHLYPGEIFGKGCNKNFRICFAKKRKDIDIFVERLKKFILFLKKKGY
jgi:aminotransferase